MFASRLWMAFIPGLGDRRHTILEVSQVRGTKGIRALRSTEPFNLGLGGKIHGRLEGYLEPDGGLIQDMRSECP